MTHECEHCRQLLLSFRCFLGRSSSHLCEQCIPVFLAAVVQVPNRAETGVGFRAADFAFGCGWWNCHVILRRTTDTVSSFRLVQFRTSERTAARRGTTPSDRIDPFVSEKPESVMDRKHELSHSPSWYDRPENIHFLSIFATGYPRFGRGFDSHRPLHKSR
jgi:hypothetical protein